MSENTVLVLPEQYSQAIAPFFNSQEEFFKVRDDFHSTIKTELEELNEKRRKSEEAAQVKRYR